MDIPVYIKYLDAGVVSALVPSIPAVSATGNSLGEAVSHLRENLRQTLEAHMLSATEVMVWLPPFDKNKCSAECSDGCWTSIEHGIPHSASKSPIRFARTEEEAIRQRSRSDRRHFLDRRLPDTLGHVQTKMFFPATFYHASRMTQALRLLMEDRTSEETRNEMEIGVMEAMTNIVRHAYKDVPIGTIEATYTSALEGITVEFKDTGSPIPSDLFERANNSGLNFDETDVANLPEGGMGVALMHVIFDSIEYNHENNINRLTLFKRI